MKTRTIVEYLLAVLIVLLLGGLAGWYFFLRTETQTINTQSAARGFGVPTPEGNAGGVFGLSSNTGASGQSGQGSERNPAQRPPQLWHVEGKPVAGVIFIGNGGTVRVRYVERATGYVFEADPETGQVIRLTNTLLPKIYESLLTENGHVYERSLDTSGSITTFVGTVATSTDSGSASSTAARTLLGSYLAKDIMQIGVNPKTDSLFYLVKNAEGVAGVSGDWNGAKLKTIFSSPIMNWQVTVLRDGRIVLSQAAADSVPGYAFELQKNGALDPLLGPVSGLTVRARSVGGQAGVVSLLWGQSIGGTMSLYAQVSQNAKAVRLPVKTVADKCAWTRLKEAIAYCGVPQGSAGQNYLDDWYRGAVHSSDALWRIDASAGTAEMVYTPPPSTSIDMEDIVVDESANYITFINAADQSLWLLRLTK